MDYFAVPTNQRLLEVLDSFGLQMEEVQTGRQFHTAFQGKRFVVSGVFERYSREAIKNEIEQLGGIIVSSVSSKTDYLVAGQGIGPSKKTKAEAMNIPILSEPDFITFKGNTE